jgi:ATP-dependent protease ClpP protease subunit
MADFFSNLSDEDFFSNKLYHIYLHNKINIKTITKLIQEIKTANNIKNPKPILIHIACSGGSFIDGLRLISIFKISKVPIATIIDNYCFSAATFLAIISPYRVMTKFSFCLFHEYSINGYINKKRKDISNYLKSLDTSYDYIIKLYLKKTKLKKEELLEILEKDYFLPCDFCYNKGIVDRVIFNTNTNTNTNANANANIKDIYSILKNPKNKQVFFKCYCSFSEIDKIIYSNTNTNICLLFPNYNNCKKKLYTEQQTVIYNILNNFALIHRVETLKKTSSTKIIGIIDSIITLDKLLPLLYADKIYMYNYCHIICDYNNINMNNNNNKLVFNIIKLILQTKTKMKIKEIDNITNNYVIINPLQAKKWGLCNDIINV